MWSPTSQITTRRTEAFLSAAFSGGWLRTRCDPGASTTRCDPPPSRSSPQTESKRDHRLVSRTLRPVVRERPRLADSVRRGNIERLDSRHVFRRHRASNPSPRSCPLREPWRSQRDRAATRRWTTHNLEALRRTHRRQLERKREWCAQPFRQHSNDSNSSEQSVATGRLGPEFQFGVAP